MTQRIKPFVVRRRIISLVASIALFVSISAIHLSADDIKLESFPRGKWLDVTWQAYWTFGDDTIKLLDVRDAEIYDFAGIVQNMKVTNLPKGGVRLTFDCEKARRSYLFEKTSATSPMQMVIRQKGSSIAYRIAMPPVSDTQLTDYKAAVIAEKPAEVAKIVASIQDIPSSAKVAQQAEKARGQTAIMLDVAATADFQKLETMAAEAEKEGLLDVMIQSLEAEAAKDGAPPAVFISLSVLYGRKNLRTQSYAALELAEKAPVPPNVSLNVSLLYGRKKLLAGAPDASTFMVGDIELLEVPDEVPVIVDGDRMGTGSMTLSKIPAGMHVITCDHPDYQYFTTVIELGVGQREQVRVVLPKKSCIISFFPTVPGNAVYVDGVKSPYDSVLVVPPGKHTIDIRDPNYKPVTVQCEGFPGKTVSVSWLRENAEIPWDISSDPEGATVSIDGKEIGITPLADVSVLSGTHEVSCAWPGASPAFYTQSFYLKGEETKGTLVFAEPFVIPTKTIKLDGKNDDWADVDGVRDAAILQKNDPSPELQGNFISKTRICQDEKYVYWYMEFADGKPKFSTGYSYSVHFRKNANDWKDLVLAMSNTMIYGTDSQTWKVNIPTNYTTKDNSRVDMWNGLGSASHVKIGENFIEARYSRTAILKALGETDPVYLSFESYVEGGGGRTNVDWGVVYFKR